MKLRGISKTLSLMLLATSSLLAGKPSTFSDTTLNCSANLESAYISSIYTGSNQDYIEVEAKESISNYSLGYFGSSGLEFSLELEGEGKIKIENGQLNPTKGYIAILDESGDIVDSILIDSNSKEIRDIKKLIENNSLDSCSCIIEPNPSEKLLTQSDLRECSWSYGKVEIAIEDNSTSTDSIASNNETRVLLGTKDDKGSIEQWGVADGLSYRKMITDTKGVTTEAKIYNYTDISPLETHAMSAYLTFYEKPKNETGLGVGVNLKELNRGEFIKVSFDDGIVAQNAEIGFSGLGSHYRENSREQARANYIALNGNKIIKEDSITKDDGTFEKSFKVDAPFDTLYFFTSSESRSSDFVVKYIDALITPEEESSTSKSEVGCEARDMGDYLIANYKFDECSFDGFGVDILDSGDRGFNALGYHLLEGGDGYLDLSDSYSESNNSDTAWYDYVKLDEQTLNCAKDFGISTWFKTDNRGSINIIGGTNSNISDELRMYLHTSNPMLSLFHLIVKSEDVWYPIRSVDLADNEWHHIFWAREGSEFKLYLDGEELNCINVNTPYCQDKTTDITTDALDIEKLVVGQALVFDSFIEHDDFVGFLDEFRLYNGVLNESEILSIYQAGRDEPYFCQSNPSEDISADVENSLEVEFDFENSQDGEYISNISQDDKLALFNSEVLNGALDLRDSNETLEYDYALANRNILNNLSKFSLSMWINTDFRGAGRALASGVNSTEFKEFRFTLYTSNPLLSIFQLRFKGTNLYFPISRTDLADGKWHQVVLSRDKEEVKLYVDRNEVDCLQIDGVSECSSGVSSVDLYTEKFVFGQSFTDFEKFKFDDDFVGLFDTIKVYNMALGEREVIYTYDLEFIPSEIEGNPRANRRILSMQEIIEEVKRVDREESRE